MERHFTNAFISGMIREASRICRMRNTMYAPSLEIIMDKIKIPTNAISGNEFYVIDTIKYKSWYLPTGSEALQFALELQRPNCASFYILLDIDSILAYSPWGATRVDRRRFEDFE